MFLYVLFGHVSRRYCTVLHTSYLCVFGACVALKPANGLRKPEVANVLHFHERAALLKTYNHLSDKKNWADDAFDCIEYS